MDNLGETNVITKVLVKEKVKSLSRVRLFATPWTVAYQAPPSMGFSSKSAEVDCRFLFQELPCDSTASLLGVYPKELAVGP